MTKHFNPRLKPDELPRGTLVDLWRRTVKAHETLRNTWHSAVADNHGMEVANAIALDDGDYARATNPRRDLKPKRA